VTLKHSTIPRLKKTVGRQQKKYIQKLWKNRLPNWKKFPRRYDTKEMPYFSLLLAALAAFNSNIACVCATKVSDIAQIRASVTLQGTRIRSYHYQ
jgi:hypothetical protein